MAGAGALDIAAQFQSTHPVRGATMDKAAAAGNNEFQSTRPVWGATVRSYKKRCTTYRFQSTRPVWGATACSAKRFNADMISIHAPRVGRDQQ